jgi:chromosome segregation ATPase
MFNNTKKSSNSLAETDEQTSGIREKYNAAIKKNEELEGELHQQTLEFKQLCTAHSVLSEGMKYYTSSLVAVREKLQAMSAQVAHANNAVFELRQVNSALKSSSDEWFKRAIKLEFDFLTVKDELTKLEHEHNLALKMCERLQVELRSTNKKNSRGRADL